jgi:hypothetical protein
MLFNEFSHSDRASLVKKEFLALVKTIFEQPEKLKAYIQQGALSNEQGKYILMAIHALNISTCACCRKMDQRKIKLQPIDVELDPLLDIARSIAREKRY